MGQDATIELLNRLSAAEAGLAVERERCAKVVAQLAEREGRRSNHYDRKFEETYDNAFHEFALRHESAADALMEALELIRNPQ